MRNLVRLVILKKLKFFNIKDGVINAQSKDSK